MNYWNENSVGDQVWITVSPDHGEYEGTITAISEVPAGGGYPIFTVDVPAYGSFTRTADDVIRRLTVMLHIDMPACDTATEMAKEIADQVPSYYPVADWEVQIG